MREISGKKVIIIGAAGGMGRSVTKAFAATGIQLFLADLSKEAVDALANEISTGEIKTYAVDATNEESVASLMQSIGEADVLINLPGISLPSKIESMQLEDYEKTMNINVKSVFLASKHFLPLAKPEGMIINMGSMAAKRANANAPLYCAAKAAVNMLSSGIAMQAAEKNIRVTTLNPGGANTAFWGNRNVPKEKMLKPEMIAEVLLFVVKMDSSVAIHNIDFESLYML